MVTDSPNPSSHLKMALLTVVIAGATTLSSASIVHQLRDSTVPTLPGSDGENPIPDANRECTPNGAKCAGAPNFPRVEYSACCNSDDLVCGTPKDMPAGLWGNFCIRVEDAATVLGAESVTATPTSSDPAAVAAAAGGKAASPKENGTDSSDVAATGSLSGDADASIVHQRRDSTVPTLPGADGENSIPDANRVCTANGAKCAGAPNFPRVEYSACCNSVDLVCGTPKNMPVGLWGNFCIRVEDAATVLGADGVTETSTSSDPAAVATAAGANAASPKENGTDSSDVAATGSPSGDADGTDAAPAAGESTGDSTADASRPGSLGCLSYSEQES